jgi:hypothetical protein
VRLFAAKVQMTHLPVSHTDAEAGRWVANNARFFDFVAGKAASCQRGLGF